MKLKGLLASLTLLIAIGAYAGAARADTANWQYHTINSIKFWLTANQDAMAKAINEASGNRVNITVFPAGASGFKGGEVLDAVSDNLLQVAEVWGGHVAGQEQVMELLDLPQFVPGDFEFRKKLWHALHPLFSEYLEKKYDVIVFDVMQINPRRLYTKTPVATLDDLKGLKIRALGLADSQFIKSLGAEATTTNWTELYTALQQGVVDGHMAADGAQFAMKFYEVTDYIFDTANAGPSFMILVNKQAYEALPADVQKILMDHRQMLRDANYASYQKSDPWARKALLEKGMKVTSVSDNDNAQMLKVADPIVEAWADKLPSDARKIFDAAKSMIDEYHASN